MTLRSWPTGWDDWVFWQTGVSRIKGLGKKLDGNVFSGSKSDLQALQLRPLDDRGWSRGHRQPAGRAGPGRP